MTPKHGFTPTSCDYRHRPHGAGGRPGESFGYPCQCHMDLFAGLPVHAIDWLVWWPAVVQSISLVSMSSQRVILVSEAWRDCAQVYDCNEDTFLLGLRHAHPSARHAKAAIACSYWRMHTSARTDVHACNVRIALSTNALRHGILGHTPNEVCIAPLHWISLISRHIRHIMDHGW